MVIQQSSMNQMCNANNPYQGTATKALCVCSAGLLRSPSIARVLSEKGYNVRACGTSQEFALIPLSTALLEWADEIHVVKDQAVLVSSLTDKPIIEYDIPDMYGTFEPELMQLIKDRV